MRKRMMRRMGSGGMFGSMSSNSMSGDNSLKYYCMSCGTQHKQTGCPNCGSKMKRVGWWLISSDDGNQKVRCTVLGVFNAVLHFFLVSILMRQYAENVFRRQSH